MNTVERTRDGVTVTVSKEEIDRLRAENAQLRASLDRINDECLQAEAALAQTRQDLLDTTWQDHADHWQKRAVAAEAALATARELLSTCQYAMQEASRRSLSTDWSHMISAIDRALEGRDKK